jgi:hypothetical protein
MDQQATAKRNRVGIGQPRVGLDAREVAVDRFLDLERVGLPYRLLAASQPFLNGGPLWASMFTDDDEPVPRLHGMGERPQVTGRAGGIERRVEVGLETGPVGVRQSGAVELCPLGKTLPARLLRREPTASKAGCWSARSTPRRHGRSGHVATASLPGPPMGAPGWRGAR